MSYMIIGTFDEPWFCGKDICNILGYSDIQRALWDYVKKT